MNIVSILIGVVAAIITKYVCDYLGVPNPLDWILAIVVFIGVAFGWSRFNV